MTDKEKIRELKNLVEVLCDNISDQPAGCEACYLWEDGICDKQCLQLRKIRVLIWTVMKTQKNFVTK